MKKLLMMVLVGIMSVSMLAGCGKSEEELLTKWGDKDEKDKILFEFIKIKY